MTTPPPSSSGEDESAHHPSWRGYWRVTRYGGEEPECPTFYEATEKSWDVIKLTDEGLYEARHPILSIEKNSSAGAALLVLKDEGEPDEAAERWRVELNDDQLRVSALDGPHEGAVGTAVRIDGDPRERTTQ
jgi:hypothetical protein